MLMSKILFSIFGLLLAFSYQMLNAQLVSQREFDNINNGNVQVNCFFEDSFQRIWTGTSEGMYVKNKSAFSKYHAYIGELHKSISVYTTFRIDDDHYYIGTGAGLYLLDLKTDTYTFIYETGAIDIRTMVQTDANHLLLGTMNGVVRFNMQSRQTRMMDAFQQKPSMAILKCQDFLYVGSDGVFYQIDGHGTILSFGYPSQSVSSPLTLSMAKDPVRQVLWIGTESDLLSYDLRTRQFTCVNRFAGNSINAIKVDQQNKVWLGTNSGLLIYHPEQDHVEYYVHSSYDAHSLANNVVRSFFEDINHSIWVGTDCGVSRYRPYHDAYVHRWEKIIRSEEGNRITAIAHDAEGDFWIGGTNGLLRKQRNKKEAQWFRMRSNRTHIGNNLVRQIFVDSERHLWIVTDGGLFHFDYAKERFVSHTIKDDKGIRYTNKCYSMSEDSLGHFWLSYSWGGVVCVDRQQLLQSQQGDCPALASYTPGDQPNGLISMRIQHSVVDQEGNVWVSAGIDGLNKIRVDGKGVEYFASSQSEKQLSVVDINTLFCDAEGYVWVAGIGALDRINTHTNAVTKVQHQLLKDKSIQSIVEKGNNLWLLFSNGFLIMDKQTFEMRFLALDDAKYACAYLDPNTQDIWAGGIDQVFCFNPNSILTPKRQLHPVILSSVIINDQFIQTGEAYNGNVILPQSPAYLEELTLLPMQNNLAIEFDDMNPRDIEARYRYRLVNADQDWRLLDANSFRIAYSNLQPGDYVLEIQQTGLGFIGVPPVYQLSIKVLPPWYLSIPAKATYIILLIGLLLWVANYLRIRNRLQIERIEREKVMELSDMKMVFLTDISHELKTPLSLILEPVNRLLATTKNPVNRQLLQTVHSNAMRLSKLVHQIIELKDESLQPSMLHLSTLEMVEFASSMVAVYREKAELKGVELRLHTPSTPCYVEADPMKMESILGNLLSNAIKFTPSGGSVNLTIDEYQKEGESPALRLCVADTGAGIPQADLPHIFERFYQSEANESVNVDGSGIGLAVVRTYVADHAGCITVDSTVNQGTTFTVILPILTQADQAEKLPDLAVPTVDPNDENLPRILIVEDNMEIARLMLGRLDGMRCRAAHNGKAGLSMALEWMPDLIISDIMMPIMDGIEMSRRLKRNLNTNAIPIILLTAKDNKQTELEAYKIGVDAFLSKPFELDQLLARIRQLLKNKTIVQRQALQTVESNLSDEQLAMNQATLSPSADELFLADLSRIIEEHMDDPELNVQKLSSLSGINSKQIYRKVKLLTGGTAVDYIKSIRLKKASLLLKQRRFTVSEVMYMVGFSNPSYFARCFMEKYGKSPKNYMSEL